MNKQKNNNALITFMLLATSILAVFGQSYSVPSPISAYDVAKWVIAGGQIASGTVAPSAVASEGALYVDSTIATQPILYRYGAGAWSPISAGGAGIATHSLLNGLSFADSGHSGFASEAALLQHVASQTDPHGATMTVSQEISVGDPTATKTAFITNPSAGLISIASNAMITENPLYSDNAAAIAGGLATGTLYHDASGVVRIVY